MAYLLRVLIASRGIPRLAPLSGDSPEALRILVSILSVHSRCPFSVSSAPVGDCSDDLAEREPIEGGYKSALPASTH